MAASRTSIRRLAIPLCAAAPAARGRAAPTAPSPVAGAGRGIFVTSRD